MRRIFVLVLLILAFCIGGAFSYHNPTLVEIDYLAGKTQLSLGVLMILTAIGAMVLASVMAWMGTMPIRAERRRLRRELDKVERELRSLRDLPLKDA